MDSAIAPPFTPSDLPSTQHFPQSALLSPEAWYSYLDLHKSKLPQDLYRKAKERGTKLLDLAKTVAEMGGWQRVTALGKWQYVDSMLGGEEGSARGDYQALLLPILKKMELALRYSDENPFKVTLNILQFDCLRAIPVVYPPTSGRVDNLFWQNLFAQEIVILRGFGSEVWPINHGLFSLQTMESKHGEAILDVKTVPTDPDPTKAYPPTDSQSSLGAFVPAACADPTPGLASTATASISHWPEALSELRKNLPKSLLFSCESDALFHTRSHLPPITVPQVAISTEGFWLGAHQQPLCFPQVSFNSGPGAVQMWALALKYVPGIRKEVSDHLHFDLFSKEKQWWPDENYLLSRGFATFCGEQQPGDIVYTGIGTLLWTKSGGTTVTVSWNTARKELRQFEAALRREGCNRRAKAPSLVPLYTLAVDLLNAEVRSLPDDLALFLYEKVAKRVRKEEGVVGKVGILMDSDGKLGPEMCSDCRQEAFLASYQCGSCGGAVLCGECASDHNLEHKSTLKGAYLCEKSKIEAVLRRVLRRKEPGGECVILGLTEGTEKALKYKEMEWGLWGGAEDCVIFKELPQKRVRTARHNEESANKRRKATNKSQDSTLVISTIEELRIDTVPTEAKQEEIEEKKAEGEGNEGESSEMALSLPAAREGEEKTEEIGEQGEEGKQEYVIPKKKRGVKA